MSTTKSIETTVMDAIDHATQATFESMLGKAVQKVEAEVLDGPTPACNGDESAISVVMGWTGGLTGSLTMTLTAESAIGWTAGLLGESDLAMDQDVVDAVGELGNLIAGCAKSKLPEFEITMSLPVVIHAGLGSMGLQSNTTDIRMAYEFGEHRLTILIALRD